MFPKRSILVVSLMSLNLISLAGVAHSSFADSLDTKAAVTQQTRKTERVDSSTLPFEENIGQFPLGISYYKAISQGNIYVASEGNVAYQLIRTKLNQGADNTQITQGSEASTIRESWQGAQNIVPKGAQLADTKINRFQDVDQAKWRSNISTYETIALGEIWPGVEVSLHRSQKSLRKVFVLGVGAKPDDILSLLEGADTLKVDQDGKLLAAATAGDLGFSKPEAYQEIGGEKIPVEVSYTVEGHKYGFQLGEYNYEYPVTIATTLLQTSYFGGNDGDNIEQFALNRGKVFTAGITVSTNLPATAAGYQPSINKNFDFFVARFNADLTKIEQATYLGGTGSDGGFLKEGSCKRVSLAFDPVGNVYVAGTTDSPQFPGAAAGAHPVLAGKRDVVVAQLNNDLNALSNATYYGGGEFDHACDVAYLPERGEIIVAGYTYSTDLPDVSPGASQPTAGKSPSPRTAVDGFAVRISGDLKHVYGATYLGGSGVDIITSMLVHNDTLFVAGSSNSSDLPGTSGACQAVKNGDTDAIIMSVPIDLMGTLSATYFNGTKAPPLWFPVPLPFPLPDPKPNAKFLGLAIHPGSNLLYVVGETDTTNLPYAKGSFQADYPLSAKTARTPPSRLAGFIVGDLPLDLKTCAPRATYFAGAGDDSISSINFEPPGDNIIIGGQTSSEDLPGASEFLADTGIRSALQGEIDGFLARMARDLTKKPYSLYFGGSDWDNVENLVFDPEHSRLYFSGNTMSNDLPRTANGGQDVYGGPMADGFISWISPSLFPNGPVALDLKLSSKTVKVGMPVSVDVRVSGFEPSDIVDFTAKQVVLFGVFKPVPIKGTCGSSLSLGGSFGGHVRRAKCSVSFDSPGLYLFEANYRGDNQNLPANAYEVLVITP